MFLYSIITIYVKVKEKGRKIAGQIVNLVSLIAKIDLMKRIKKDEPKRSYREGLILEKKDSLTYSTQKWDNKFIDMVYRLALLGLTDKQIAEVLLVHQTTIDTWKRNYPEFFESMKRGKAEADSYVVEALYGSALGWSHPQEVVTSEKIKRFENGKLVEEKSTPKIVTITKHHPPNVKAAIKILESRHPEQWAAIKRMQIRSQSTVNINMSDFNEEELMIMEKVGLKNLIEEGNAEDVTND